MAVKLKGAEQVFFDAERVFAVHKYVFHLLIKSPGAFGRKGCNYLKVCLVLEPEIIN